MKTELEYKIEFGKQVKRYLAKSGLNSKEFASLLRVSTDYIDSIIKGEMNINMNKMIKIASFFGVDYYDFANPNFQIPKKEDLHKSNRSLLNSKKTKMDTAMGHKGLFSKELDRLIAKGLLNTPTTSKIIHKKMNIKFKNRNPNEITSYFINSLRSKYIKCLDHKYLSQNIYVHTDHWHKFKTLTKEELALLMFDQELKLGIVQNLEG